MDSNSSDEIFIKYLKDLNLAIVDDSRLFGAEIGAMVSKYVKLISIYQDARIALEEFKKYPPDIIITDLEMPEFDGFQLVKELKLYRELQDIPILVLTGKENFSIMAKVITLGADSFVKKSEVRDSIILQLLALARLREVYKRGIRGKQLEAVQSLIVTYKHEFGNVLAIIDGKLRKLRKGVLGSSDSETIDQLQTCSNRMVETLDKLSKLRDYREETYIGNTKMLKTD